MGIFFRISACLGLILLFSSPLSCSRSKSGDTEAFSGILNIKKELDSAFETGVPDREFISRLEDVMCNSGLPDHLIIRLREISFANPDFFNDLFLCLEEDFHLRELVDKQHPLPAVYIPLDLTALADSSYLVGRAGLMLRRDAAAALEKMAEAAKADGVTLVAASAYRSYDYQEMVYNRNVLEMGREAADRESALPGHSQHQTGLSVDFGPIDDSFAVSTAGRWTAENAFRFGWSLSYPDGYEEITGYRWESWHFRYVGKNLIAFINQYFDGIQQYALRFLHEWEK